MDMETSPDCVCKGTGRVPFHEGDPPGLMDIPCGHCLQRYEDTHCVNCDKRLGDKTYPWPESPTWRACAECVPVAIILLKKQRKALEGQINLINSQLIELDSEVDLTVK